MPVARPPSPNRSRIYPTSVTLHGEVGQSGLHTGEGDVGEGDIREGEVCGTASHYIGACPPSSGQRCAMISRRIPRRIDLLVAPSDHHQPSCCMALAAAMKRSATASKSASL